MISKFLLKKTRLSSNKYLNSHTFRYLQNKVPETTQNNNIDKKVEEPFTFNMCITRNISNNLPLHALRTDHGK